MKPLVESAHCSFVLDAGCAPLSCWMHLLISPNLLDAAVKCGMLDRGRACWIVLLPWAVLKMDGSCYTWGATCFKLWCCVLQLKDVAAAGPNPRAPAGRVVDSWMLLLAGPTLDGADGLCGRGSMWT
ncbi:hypothetical protein VIGAN_UM018100 [Vigna angularis var. angularis]|uniref:Uncharacterized protein n=1 Tax=Vigna angularis var. angularis TaxID=157739 RepID=A0A0S3TDV0_PHAAN|nr:hypothetical protein VIGAN_UM018100 [Vigna angularis var. angularis]